MSGKIDYIIVGGGLAGSCLAIQLLEKGASVLVVQGSVPTASRAAAGLFNPITGRHMVKTWLADEIFPYLVKFYSRLEERWGCQFLHFLPIYKPFASFEDQNNFMAQQAENAYEGFLDTNIDHKAYSPFVFNEKKGFQTLHSGFVDVNLFLDKTHEWLIRKTNLIYDQLDPSSLRFSSQGVEWNNWQAKGIIFCEGMNANTNTYFSWVPVNASKGEVIQVKIPQFTRNVIFNKQVFMVPSDPEEYKVGSTYYWKFENDKPSEKGRQELSERLTEMIRYPFTITQHWAGIRPASRDRKPYLGKHSKHPNAYIFNGLGAKGVSLAPYFSEKMADFILNEIEPDSSVNITRLKSLYSQI